MPTTTPFPTKTELNIGLKTRSRKLPIDLEVLTPLERTRLDTAVMALVEYLVSTSTKTA